MLITKTSIVSGKEHTLDVPVTQEEIDHYNKGGVLIQHAFPHLSDDEREFLMTGITAEEWAATFPEEDEDE